MLRNSTESTIIIPQLDDHHSRPLMAKMARLLRQIGAIVEAKRFRQNLSLPREAQRLSQRAFRLYDEYLIYCLGKLQKQGWQLYCASGCAACCFSMPAGISNWEFFLIYDHLQQTGQLERFFRRNLESCQVLARVRGQLANEWRRGQFDDRSEYEALLHDYSKAKHPCAFLSEARECIIYSVRPLACRMHFSFTPPELCDPTHPQFSHAARLNLGVHTEVEEELKKMDSQLNMGISDLLAPGLVSLTANILRFSPISWT